MAEKIGPIFNRILIKKLDQALENGSINKKDYNDLKKKYFGKPKLIQMDLFDPDKKKQGGLMEATKRLKAQGLRKGGKAPKKLPGEKPKKKLTPQEKKDLIDKIKKSEGKMTNPFLKFNKLGQPYMEAKKGGAAKKFPDLSGDGKVTMKDILMGRGVVKKPKKKAMGGSMTLEGGKLKGVKDAPEERRKEKIQKIKGFLKRRSLLNPMGGARGLGKVAGRAAKRGYGIAKK
jgi:hypothetical protein